MTADQKKQRVAASTQMPAAVKANSAEEVGAGELGQSGQIGLCLVMQCSIEIDSIMSEILRVAAKDVEQGPLLRALAARVLDINSVVMSFADRDPTTVMQAHETIYRDARPLGRTIEWASALTKELSGSSDAERDSNGRRSAA